MKKYVIIGNGTAAAGCIEGIRSVDAESPITVVSKENHPVYCRPLISYYLEGKASPEKMNYRPADFYSSNGCSVIYGVTAEKIDPKERKVVLSDGTELPYTSVCVAAGSSPFLPAFEGLETVKNQFRFMTLDDAEALGHAVNESSRVLIIGAGLIGLKCAEGLTGRVGRITVCDLADRVMSSVLDTDAASVVQKHLEENGMKFLLSESVLRFDGNTAVMKSGKTVDFDILVTAVGVRANVSLVSGIGGTVGRGITVDTSMRTDIDGVFAAGDCTEGYDLTVGKNRVLALMPNAYMQGHAAGVNMAGGNEIFDKGIPMNSIGFFGLHVMTAGNCTGECISAEDENGSKRRFFIEDGFLNGFIFVGDTTRAGIFTSLIRNKVRLDEIDFGLLVKTSSFTAFSQKNRGKMFGGVV